MGVLSRIGHVVTHPLQTLGITHAAPPDISKGPDAEALRRFSGTLVDEYNNRVAGTATKITPTMLDRTQSDQARGVQQSSIGGLQDVAGGGHTAADSLLQRGLDVGARSATGLAAAYSTSNPGEALRQGLAAGNDLYARGASDAGILKGNEQAAARGQLVDAANAMRSGDIGTATTDASAANSAAGQNQVAELTQQDINNRKAQSEAALALGGLKAPFDATKENADIQAKNDAANSTATGSIIGAGGEVISHSDERLKKNVRDGSGDADQFLASLSPRVFEMKDPNDVNGSGPGPSLGTVAQEMRPRDIVTGADGAKWISADIIGKVLAGMGRINERVVAVEGSAKKPERPEDVNWGPNSYAREPPPKPIPPSSRGRRA